MDSEESGLVCTSVVSWKESSVEAEEEEKRTKERETEEPNEESKFNDGEQIGKCLQVHGEWMVVGGSQLSFTPSS